MASVMKLIVALVFSGLGALLAPAQDQPTTQPPKPDDKKAAAWVEPDKSEPAGMKYRTFQSKTTGGEVSYLIYLPPDYDTHKDQRYPVVYWLHGRGGSQTGAGQLAGRLDKAITAGKAPPMIVVGVNGMRTSSYVDSADGKTPVQSVIVKDLIPHIDATYRTIAKREGRAIEGFSMGGAGAPKIGFKYPELFGTVSILAGALHDLESYKARGTAFQDIYGGKDEYFQANSPWKLVEKNADAVRGKTSVRIVVGDKDGLHGRNRDYHELLDKLKIGHEFHVIKDMGHAAGLLYDALGDKNWQFYAQAFAGAAKVIGYSGDGSDLQKVINEAPTGATLIFDGTKRLEFSAPITINKPLTVTGLNARLPKGLGKTMMLVVTGEGVTLRNIELHGNYDSVSQNKRAPLVWVQKGRFRIERCKFCDGSKDGVMVTPVDGGGDIVGGVIKDMEAFRMGRDAVSISGGNAGAKVRNVTVENVSLKRGFLRGAVEVSDGTDSITVRHVYAEEALYAIDVQDHGEGSAANTKITVEDVEAVNCKHILRTANSDRGHADLTLRRLTGKNCQTPVQISFTRNVLVEDLTIINDKEAETAPIGLKFCRGVRFKNVRVNGLREGVDPIATFKCTELKVEGLKRGSGAGDAKADRKFVPLFDGKTLDGWVVRAGKAAYKVEDNVIVGATVEGSPNTFLCTKKEYGDFELAFEVKCDPKLNSGVQVRSHAYAKDTPQPSNPKRIRPAGDVYGPQVEIAADGNAGRIWDEARHAKWHDPEPGEKARNAYKPDEWNRYRIVAQGDRIRTWVNDVPVADIRVKEKEDAAGFIGLQVHSIKPGTGPYQVRWRNIQIRELKPDEKID